MNRASLANYNVPSIAANIMIMTRAEFNQHMHVAFNAGVERGKFESGMPDALPRTVSDADHEKIVPMAATP